MVLPYFSTFFFPQKVLITHNGPIHQIDGHEMLFQIEKNPAIATQKNGHFSIIFLFKTEPPKKYSQLMRVQYIKLKAMKCSMKCKKKARLQKKPDKQGLGRLVLYWAAQNNGYVWNEVYFIKKKGLGGGSQ